MSTASKNIGTDTNLTITNLNSLASSQTAGWKSSRIDNTSEKALDYEVVVKLDMANTAPANDKMVYVYVSPAYYDGSTWYQTDGGTATLPDGSEGTYTIANPNNLRLLGVLAYTTADMVMQGVFSVCAALGFVPDGFQIIIINYTGASIASSGNLVSYKPIKEDIA